MILPDRIAHAVAAGEVTVAYRRWRQPRVRRGSTFRTVAGIVRIDAIECIDPERLGETEAQAAGYDSLAGLKDTFRGDDTDPLFRLALSRNGADPRDALADDADLARDDIAGIDALLDRLDAHTPWARDTLARICAEPGISAAALSADLPLGKETLKRRIRTLKEHGLTRSLPVGYELSPRGHAYLSATGRSRVGQGHRTHT